MIELTKTEPDPIFAVTCAYFTMNHILRPKQCDIAEPLNADVDKLLSNFSMATALEDNREYLICRAKTYWYIINTGEKYLL